jgi:hypothetical protein
MEMDDVDIQTSLTLAQEILRKKIIVKIKIYLINRKE